MIRKMLCIFLLMVMILQPVSAAAAAEDDFSAEPPDEADIIAETDPEPDQPESAAEPEEASPDDQTEEDALTETAVSDEEFSLPMTDGSYKDEEKKIADQIITSGMSDLQKLIAITKYAADNFDYSSRSSGDSAEGLLYYKSGNCYANSYFIIDLCAIVGIKAWLRSAGRDANASSTHVDVVALIDGEYYTAGAGSSGTHPRYYGVCEIPDGLCVENGVMYQFDGMEMTDLVIPSRSEDYYYVNRYSSKTKSGMTITQIGYSGEQCFSYGGATGLKSITLPSTVKTVTATAFKGCMDLENIYVDAANPYFTSIDGVLYSKDLTRLVCVPAKKTSVTLPTTVTKQDSDAFYGGKIPVRYADTPFEDVSDEWFADCVSFVYRRSLFMGTSSKTFSPNDTMTRGMFITVLGRLAGGGTWSALGSWSGTLGISNAASIAVRDKTTTSGSSVLARIGSSGEMIHVLSTVSSGEDGAVWYEVQYGSVKGYVRQKNTTSEKTLLYVYTGSFADLPNGAYYTGYAQWANINQVMSGVSSTAFRPNDNITRQDICVLIYRYLTNYLGRSAAAGSSFTDDADISSYAKQAVYAMKQAGIISGYPDGSFRPKAGATRAEVAAIFQNLYNYIN